ncbi:hypothetical protein D3C72_2283960 [compost metagenome]
MQHDLVMFDQARRVVAVGIEGSGEECPALGLFGEQHDAPFHAVLVGEAGLGLEGDALALFGGDIA